MYKKIFVFLFLLSFPFQFYSPNFDQEFYDIFSYTNQSGYEIEKWNVLIKEELSVERTNDLLTYFKKEDSLESLKQMDVDTYQIKGMDETESFSYTISLSISETTHVRSLLFVEIEGDFLNDKTLQFYQQFYQQMMQDFFTRSAQKYTCMMAKSNDIIEEMNFIEKLKTHFDLTNISTQEDIIEKILQQKIIYGYNPAWEEKMIVSNGPINTQIVMKQDQNEKVQMIIGTPILINEY